MNMNISDAILNLQQEFENTCELSFNVDDINCEIYIIPENEKIQFLLQVKNYSCKIKNTKTILHKVYDDIESTLIYLHDIFREDGTLKYSKIADEIFENDEKMKTSEQLTISKQMIIKSIDECCVCGDINSVYTKCNHNLCRYCFSKMFQLESCCEEHEYEKKILCPICKREIF
jgi:hypothetical protein